MPLPAHLRGRRSWLIAALIASAGVLAGIVLWGGFHTAMDYTNRLDFCVSCHEMKSVSFAEYSQSVHYKNASGVRAVCADCHVPREWLPKLIRKVEATKDLYHNILGTIDTPEKFEAQRLTMAKRVWAQMQANDSQECRNCHSWDAMDFHKQRPAAVEKMQKASQDGETCISCHKGIAHRMPDMAQGIRMAFDDLMSLAAQQGAKADTLYAVATKPMFVARPAGAAEGGGDAKLMAITPVRVVERQGDWLKIRIEGWQQEGAERALYALRGQRILAAALGNDAVAKVERLGTETDPETELVWHRAAVTLWTAKDALIADQAKLLAYGVELFADACGTCHAPPPADSQLANQWIGTMNAMKQGISIDDEQYRFLQKYLQLNARDTGGAK